MMRYASSPMDPLFSGPSAKYAEAAEHKTSSARFNFAMMFKLGICGVGLALFAASSMRAHDEAALLTDWSTPPPWPIFVALNVLAGMLRAGADALTPPPIKMLDMSMGYHLTMLAHTAQSKSHALF